jgi:hypothetical protein
MSNFHLSSTLGQQFAASYTTTDRKSSEHGANPRRTVDALAHYLETDGSLKGARMRLSETQEETAGLWSIGKTPGPTSQDAETPSHPGFHPPHLLYNRRGLTRNNSEFRRPEMWALREIQG